MVALAKWLHGTDIGSELEVDWVPGTTRLGGASSAMPPVVLELVRVQRAARQSSRNGRA
jgi:hypothetical protein